jgi:hypothetical protein
MSDDLVLHRGLDKGKCKSCKAPIVWAYTTGGKKAPFQADDQGHWTLENGTARHVGAPPAQLELGAAPGPQRYTNHFSVCPQADEWRKPR